jgi:hypothetical protein
MGDAMRQDGTRYAGCRSASRLGTAPPGQKGTNVPAPKLSFDADIKPLFREKDRDSMRARFDLWSYADVQTNADAIGEHLKNGSMPCDGAWPPDRVELFERWVEQGKPE